MRLLLAGCVAWGITALPLAGQDFDIAPFFGLRFGGEVEAVTGKNFDLQAGPAYGLTFDFAPKDSDMKLELSWSREETELDFDGFRGFSDVDVTVDQFMIGGLLEKEYGKFRFGLAGLLGATYFHGNDINDEAFFSFGVGGSVKYFLLRNLALRADLRGYCAITEGEGAFISVNGVTVAAFSATTLWQGEISAGLNLSF